MASSAPKIDLSFANYVAARKGAAAARSREGAAYAYAGDLKVRQTLSKIRPVTLAVEATVRFWQTVERGRLLGNAVKVTEKQFPSLRKMAARCAETLQIPVPTMYVSPDIGSLNAHTFGTSDEAYIVLNAALIDHLSEAELLGVIGHECGHIQNDHAIYLTTLYFLTRAGGMLLRWGAKPAVLALNAWARRSEITCDRAGLLCTRDLDVSVGNLVKLAVGSKKLYSEINVEEYLGQLEESRGPGAFTELSSTHPYLPKRVAALRVFAETTYFKSLMKGGADAAPVSGISKEECDARVAEIDRGVEMTGGDRKAAIRATLEKLAAAAEAAGLATVARDVREVRIPKLDDERFSLVVLGEFNHGKSTFVNALLGNPLLPTGITPTTAVLTHISHGPKATAELVLESGERRKLDPAHLGQWATVEGLAAQTKPAAGTGTAVTADSLHHIDLKVPAAILEGNLTIVDTPGVNDINEQRAEITYGYVPRADAAIFLLDATQILTASERQFLEERVLRSSRERLIFVIAKIDLLDEAELGETVRFAREHLARIVPEPAIFPISARHELAGKRDQSGFEPLLQHIGLTVGTDRRRLLLDHALADAGRLSAFVRQSLAMRRRSLDLPLPELEDRIARAKARLAAGQKGLDAVAGIIEAETAALKARVRQDLADFAAQFRVALPTDIDKVDGHDVRRYLSFFVQDTWKAWLENEGDKIASTLEKLAETVVEVASENVRDVTEAVSAELGPTETKVNLVIDTFRYDASVFALGALGTTVFLFVNGLVGGALALAAPLLAMVLRGKVGREIKAEARERAPEAIDRVAALLAPKLDEAVDSFASRLREFVAQAGAALARGIAEVLDRALAEKRAATNDASSSADARGIDTAVADLRAVDEQIADVRQAIWEG